MQDHECAGAVVTHLPLPDGSFVQTIDQLNALVRDYRNTYFDNIVAILFAEDEWYASLPDVSEWTEADERHCERDRDQLQREIGEVILVHAADLISIYRDAAETFGPDELREFMFGGGRRNTYSGPKSVFALVSKAIGEISVIRIDADVNCSANEIHLLLHELKG